MSVPEHVAWRPKSTESKTCLKMQSKGIGMGIGIGKGYMRAIEGLESRNIKVCIALQSNSKAWGSQLSK